MSQGPPPPAPYPAQPAPPPPSSKVPLLVGALIGAVAPWSFSLVPLILTGGSSVAGYGLYAWLLVPVVGIGLLLAPATRRWGAGVLIGYFGMLVVGAGACLVLVVGLNATGVGG
jgi:hypothetical protein